MSSELLVRNVPPTVRSWINRERQTHRMSQQEFVLSILERARDRNEAPLPPLVSTPTVAAPDQLPFTFIDLFAGIGGFRIALEKVGGQCRFSCEWDKYSQKTYKAWFGESPHGDVHKVKASGIPFHDILAAGFPCQPFSIAGVSKKKSLGRAHGFMCESQGNLFFDLATIIEQKRPPAVFLENVKNLQSHDRGRTWEVIFSTLENLGYSVFHKVIDAAGWVPQHRERVYIVCFDTRVFRTIPPFTFPDAPPRPHSSISHILEENPDPKHTLSDHLWNYLQEYAERHRSRGNGFGFGLVDLEGITRTLSARYFKDGSEILIPQRGRNPRRLTPRECARLMGFDDARPIVVSDTQAYKQFGNAVVPKVVEDVARQIVKVLAWQVGQNGGLLKRRHRRVSR